MAFSSSDCPPTAVECPQGAAMTHPESTPKLNDDSNSVEASATGNTLPKKLRWFDGFAMSMTMPAALLATLGASITGLGGWGAAALWAISMILALGVNCLYTELAAMFPTSSGGIAHYAAQAWKSRAPWVAPLAGIGYWFPWGTNLATYGAITGGLIQAQWFPEQTWEVQLGPVSITLPLAIGLAVIVLLYAINVVGVRVTMAFVYVTAGILMIPLAVFIIFPLFNSGWAPLDLTWKLEGWTGVHQALVWLYVMAWTTLGIEVCATFAPEYRDSVKDTVRAIRAAVLLREELHRSRRLAGERNHGSCAHRLALPGHVDLGCRCLTSALQHGKGGRHGTKSRQAQRTRCAGSGAQRHAGHEHRRAYRPQVTVGHHCDRQPGLHHHPYPCRVGVLSAAEGSPRRAPPHSIAAVLCAAVGGLDGCFRRHPYCRGDRLLCNQLRWFP